MLPPHRLHTLDRHRSSSSTQIIVYLDMVMHAYLIREAIGMEKVLCEDWKMCFAGDERRCWEQLLDSFVYIYIWNDIKSNMRLCQGNPV